MIKKVLFKILLLAKEIKDIFSTPLVSKYIHKDLPFYTQDKTGARDKKGHEIWKNNGCGLACLKMILKYQLKKEYSIVDLGSLSMKYGCFKRSIKPNMPWDWLDGLFYKPFVVFIKEEFGLQGQVVSPMTVLDMLKETASGNFVIASVSSSLSSMSKPNMKRGHLVLISGYDLNKGVIYLHNPSWYQPKPYERVLVKDFKRYFANRGIVINKN